MEVEKKKKQSKSIDKFVANNKKEKKKTQSKEYFHLKL
jgi:hypothetical protein